MPNLRVSRRTPAISAGFMLNARNLEVARTLYSLGEQESQSIRMIMDNMVNELELVGD